MEILFLDKCRQHQFYTVGFEGRRLLHHDTSDALYSTYTVLIGVGCDRERGWYTETQTMDTKHQGME